MPIFFHCIFTCSAVLTKIKQTSKWKTTRAKKERENPKQQSYQYLTICPWRKEWCDSSITSVSVLSWKINSKQRKLYETEKVPSFHEIEHHNHSADNNSEAKLQHNEGSLVPLWGCSPKLMSNWMDDHQ